MMGSDGVRQFQSLATDAVFAVKELHDGVVQPDMALVIFFCSPLYELDVIAQEMQAAFPATVVIGCTTAGEIGSEGYRTHSLVGASFSKTHFKATTGCVADLQNFSIAAGRDFAHSLLQRHQQGEPYFDPGFAFMLIDGLSVREEPVAHAFQHALGSMPLIGGSAGDEKRFGRSYVYCDGRFQHDAVVLALVDTDLPFQHFKTQHFSASETRLVITRADAARRIVYEINGLPAADEYARLIGAARSELDSMRFAATPVVMRINGKEYVRSIQKANPDGSLTFYCAIDEGLVLRLAHGTDRVATLENSMAALHQQIGEPQIVLGCDCVLRSQEFAQAGLKDEVGDIYRREHLMGYSSYGEQYLGIHVNQTLTGLAIGSPSGAKGDV